MRNFHFCILSGCQSKLLSNISTSVPVDSFHLSNSADPDEMLPYSAFHMGLHCLPKNCLLNEKLVSVYVFKVPTTVKVIWRWVTA